MAAITPTALFGPTPIPSAAATSIYTVPAGATATVQRAVVTNESAAGATLTIWVVRSGGSPVDGNILVGAAAAGQALSAGPSDPYVVQPMASLVLAAGDQIFAQSSVNDVLNFIGSGWVYTP